MPLKSIKSVLSRHIVLAFTVFALFACSGEIDDQKSVEAAKQYLDKNKLREASLELKTALQNNSDNAEARYLLGQLNIIFGDMSAAAKEFRKAELAGWDEGQSRVGQARALTKLQDFKKVIDETLIKDSYSAEIRANLYGLKAYSYAALGDREKANQLISEGEAIDANALQILKTSIQLKLTGNNESLLAGLQQLEQATALYKDDTELLLLAAYGALRAQDADLAVKRFERVISLEPDNLVTYNGRSARLGLARIEILRKDFDKAKALLEPLFKQSPKDPETNYIGGLLAFEQGDYELAEKRVLNVLKLLPENAKTQLLFGAVNFAQKDYEQTSYYIVKYLNQEPGNIGARKLLGRTYILMGQHDDAQAVLRGAKDEGDAELLALIGLSQLESGDIDSGLSGLRKAVDVAPEKQSLRSELARAYITAGETEKAINQLNTILAEGGNKDQAEVLKVTAYLRDQQYDQAINLALEILERSPQSPAMLSLAGNVFAASGDRVEARKYFTRAREIEPEYSAATMLLAALAEEDGDYKQAEKLYLSIDSKDDPSSDHLLALARLSGKQGDEVAMIDWLEKARRESPGDIRSRLILAEYYLQDEKIAKAEELVNEIKGIAPNDPRVLVLQGKVLLAQQRYNEALVPLKELVTRESKTILGRTLLGEVYMRLGQLSDARRQLELALKINEFDLASLLLIAKTELADGQIEKAVSYSRKAQKVNPDLFLGYELEGDIQFTSKNYPAASELYKHALSIQPSLPLSVKLSNVLVNMGRLEQAKQPLLQWLSDHPDDVSAHQQLAGIYQSLNEDALAVRSFEIVISEQPDNVIALNNLAWLLSLEKDPEAVKMAEKAYGLAPENPGVQDTYGWLLVNYGQAEKGKQVLEQALKGLPDVAEVQYHYAVALAKTGETIEAKKRLQGLLQKQQSFTGIEDARSLLQSLQ